MKPTQYPRRIIGIGFALAFFLTSGLVTQPVHAQKFKVLYAFKGSPDGAAPWTGGTLTRDSAGNLYGATSNGGDSGNGTCTLGCGTVFKVDPRGHETILYRFQEAPPDGNFPALGVTRDSAGNLYGTTYWGGTDTIAGAVYKVTEKGSETVLYSFQAGMDGYRPQSTLLLDSAGNLFGTTEGTVFELIESGQKTNLHVFTGAPDGNFALAGLIRDAEGNFYGTTYAAGNTGCLGNEGCGTLFKLDPAGKETILYRFTGGKDGAYPEWGSLARDRVGNLYGTAFSGGLSANNCITLGCGVVFRLSQAGKLTVLHSFTGGVNGVGPYAGVARDKSGNLYGTVYSGGDLSCLKPYGCGLVFKLNTHGKFTVLHRFTGNNDGLWPLAGVMLDKAGNVYGTAAYGGRYGNGVVFKITP
jgi:uncharacterized repeat protein (TIGR03803 family)